MNVKPTTKSVDHSLHVPLDVYYAIKEIAEKQQRSFNWIVVQILREKLEEEKKDQFGA